VRIGSPAAGARSIWTDCPADQSPKAMFSVPEAIDTASLSAQTMAQSITECWSPGPVTEALRPVVVSLITLGQQYPSSEALEEEVPQSIYVMF
jgi:hypothetical protein